MPSIVKQVEVTYILKSAVMQEDGRLAPSFDVLTDGAITANLNLFINSEASSIIMDSPITDGSSIRNAIILRIYNYFLNSGELAGTLTA